MSTPAPSVYDRSFFGHPAGLSTLFFTEMWERFSYYGMRAILLLYMTKAFAEGGLGFDEKYAGLIYGTYVSSVWYLPLPGGWLADRIAPFAHPRSGRTIRFTGRARRPWSKRTISGVRAPVQPLVGRAFEATDHNPQCGLAGQSQ